MPLDKGIYFCIKYYLYIIYLLYGWGKLVSSIQVQQGAKITPVPFEAGETLLSALRRAGYSIPAACGGKGLGAAVDLGTTTVALRLFDRADGKLLAQAQDWNAQAPYGADVISRIQHTMEAFDGLGELSRCIRAQTETLLGQTLSAAGRKTDEVKELIIAGNTVMQHLFDGREVASIARAPFQPETLFDACETGSLHSVPVRFAPCVAGYVGGDITAGLLAAGLAELPGEHLFLDIGTNGEMALGGRGGFTCCAVASGPAFEGAGISCGMPGVDGAVSRVQYDRGFVYDVIGGGVPKGLCGSGLLDLTAVLLCLGAIAPGGRLLPPEQAPAALRRHLTHDADGNGCFHLTPEVALTAADVRNLQLAKAAVTAGIRVLLQQRGLTPEQLDGVYLAGGFGSYLDPESAAAIGMLPRACAGKLHTLGNTALAGAAMLTLDGAQWQRIRSISRACSYLELSGRADFAAAFTENLSFPQP